MVILKDMGRRVLALVVVLTMCVGLLPTTAFAAEAEPQLICGQEEHIHTSACKEYEDELHVHTSYCYKKVFVLVCDNEDEEHLHDSNACYEEDAEWAQLVCLKTEHPKHVGTCFYELICGKEEHTHTAECYSKPAEPEKPTKDCTEVEGCTAAIHVGTCPENPNYKTEKPAESKEPEESKDECTRVEGCTATTHVATCPSNPSGKTEKPAEPEKPTKDCTRVEGCTATVHVATCPENPNYKTEKPAESEEPEKPTKDCTEVEGCTAASHVGTCPENPNYKTEKPAESEEPEEPTEPEPTPTPEPDSTPAACVHSYNGLIAEVPASCGKDGMKAHFVCTKCGELCVGTNAVTAEKLKIPATGHLYGEKIPEKPATCGEDGVKTHYECTRCGAQFLGTNAASAEELRIPASGSHQYGDWTVTETGYVRKCEACGTEDTTTDVPAHICHFGGEYIDAGDGTHYQECILYVACHERGEAAPHDDAGTLESFDGTCLREGCQAGTQCSVCGGNQKPGESTGLNSGKHDDACGYTGEWRPVMGGHAAVLSCGSLDSAVAGHVGTWVLTVRPTAAREGEQTRTCEICGYTETQTVNRLGSGSSGEVEIDDSRVPQGESPDDDGVTIDEVAVPLAGGVVTRGEFVDYLYRCEGSPDTGLSTFIDVPADHEYAIAIGWAQDVDVAYGVGENKFLPDDPVTVEQVEKFLERYARLKGMDTRELAALTGLDSKAAAMNCDEILDEFFGGEE